RPERLRVAQIDAALGGQARVADAVRAGPLRDPVSLFELLGRADLLGDLQLMAEADDLRGGAPLQEPVLQGGPVCSTIELAAAGRRRRRRASGPRPPSPPRPGARAGRGPRRARGPARSKPPRRGGAGNRQRPPSRVGGTTAPAASPGWFAPRAGRARRVYRG